jgi:hypothetical protein
MSENSKLIIGCTAAIIGAIFLCVLLMSLDVWFKRDILGVPYCISGGGK